MSNDDARVVLYAVAERLWLTARLGSVGRLSSTGPGEYLTVRGQNFRLIGIADFLEEVIDKHFLLAVQVAVTVWVQGEVVIIRLPAWR